MHEAIFHCESDLIQTPWDRNFKSSDQSTGLSTSRKNPVNLKAGLSDHDDCWDVRFYIGTLFSLLYFYEVAPIVYKAPTIE